MFPAPRFRRLWTASAVSNLGDGLRVTALPLLAASITRDPSAIAAVTAVVWLPWLVFGIIGGTIVDRVPRIGLIVFVQVARMLVVAALGALVWLDQASMLVIYLVAFVIGVGEVLADTTMQTLIPAVVPDEDLEQANGQLYAAQAVANDFAGPPAGSVLFAAVAWIPFVLNAVAWGAAAVLLAGLRLGAPSRVERPPTTFIEDVVVGARWLWRHPVLRALLVWGAVVNASLVAFGSIYVLFALEVLGIGEAAYGFLAAAIGLGGIAGTLVAGRLVRRIGRSRLIQVGGIAAGVVAIIGGFMTSAIAFAALMFVLTASAASVSIVVSALRQSIVPNELLGRVHATFRVFSYGAIPLGALAGGWLADAFGLRAPYFIGGAIVLVMSLFIGRWVTDAAIERARPTSRSELAPSGM
ncbi:MAG TPA: MFS transporter [Candidatus Limnocylindria bacterium]|nr:MFS transporter [Candidatus Limnocylindria bacterium]